MAWIYRQAAGTLTSLDGKAVFRGWAGQGEHKNNPASQGVKGKGPLPRGRYTIGAPYASKDHGPFVLRLTQDKKNEMLGRDGFLIHGASKSKPETSSQGCIILSRKDREAVWASGDRELIVIEK